MKLFSKGVKSLLSFFCLLAAIFCFSVAAQAQTVGSTGSPFLDGEAEKVCYTNNGVSLTLNKVSIIGDGQITPLIQDTRYFTPANLEVFPDTVNGVLTFGICGGVDINTDTIEYYIKEVKLCDDDITKPNRYQAYLRNYLRAVNKNTGVITTLGYYDFDYFGAPYTPTGFIGEGYCAGVDSSGYYDYEYLKQCMVDSIDLTTQVEFTRLYIMQDSNRSYLDVDDKFDPYTLQGAVQKKCQEQQSFFITSLCDKEVLNVDFGYTPNPSPKIGFLQADLSITSSSLDYNSAISSITVDCGQGQITTSRNPTCDCDYNNLPDGYYQTRIAVNFRTGGTRVLNTGLVNIRDGNIVQGSISLTFSQNIIGSATEFIRKYNYDLTFSDYQLDGQTPYSVIGTPGSCNFNNSFDDIFYPSTKPEIEIALQECWEQQLAAGQYVDWEVVWNESNGFTVIGFANVGNVTMREPNLILPNAEEYLIEDISNFLKANDIQFHSVSIEVLGENNYTIRIYGLQDTFGSFSFFVGTAFDPNTGGGTGIASTPIDTLIVSADTTMMIDVSRYQHSGKQATTMDAFGNETYLNGYAYKVPCGGGGENEDDSCNDLQRIVRNYQFTDTLVTFPANSIFSYAFTPAFGNPLVQTGNDPIVTFSTTYSNNANLPKCFKIANDLTVDTRNGSSVYAIWIE